MVGSGQAAAAQTAGRHIEIAAILLHAHVGRYLGGAKKAVFALVDAEILRDTVGIGRIGVVPTTR